MIPNWRDVVWQTREGERIRLRDMEDDHLLTSISYLDGRIREVADIPANSRLLEPFQKDILHMMGIQDHLHYLGAAQRALIRERNFRSLSGGGGRFIEQKIGLSSIFGPHIRSVQGTSNDSCNLIRDCLIMVRMKAYLVSLLVFMPGVAATPELPAVDRIETISKSEKLVTIADCDIWSKRYGYHKVRATMSDRGAGKLWNNNCVFSPTKEKFK